MSQEQGTTGNVMAIIEELLSIAESSRKVPLTGRVMLNQDQLLDLLERLRDELPDAVTQAEWLLQEKDKLVSQTRAEAERILREAAQRAEALSSDSAIAEAARRHAEELVGQARQVAREIRRSANEYTDGLLLKVQDALVQVMRTVEAARAELRAQPAAPGTPGEGAGAQDAAARPVGGKGAGRPVGRAGPKSA